MMEKLREGRGARGRRIQPVALLLTASRADMSRLSVHHRFGHAVRICGERPSTAERPRKDLHAGVDAKAWLVATIPPA